MADSPRTLSPAVSATPYRPVAPLAVAGFGLALATVLVIGGMAVLSLWSGRPTLSGFALILAALGFAVSLAGFLHVRASEGTRAGGGLAKTGLALCALFGLSYAAFSLSMEAAIRLQGQRFTDQWLETLRNGQYEEAIRLTLRPDVRENMRAADVQARFADQLEQLREGDLARTFRNWPGQVIAEPAGIKDWGFEEGSYRVYQNYRLRTPEGPYDAMIAVAGTEGAEGGGRQWQVLLNKTGARQSGYTRLGVMMNECKSEMMAFVRVWQGKLSHGETAAAYLQTLDPAERAKHADDKSPPGLADFPASLIKVREKPPTDEERAKYAAAVKSGALNLAPGANPIRPASQPEPRWGLNGLSYWQIIQITPPGEPAGTGPYAWLKVDVVGADLQKELLRLKGPGWEDQPLMKIDENYAGGMEIKPYPHNCRITEIDVRPEIKPPEAFRPPNQ
jgi:hypothetical protein